MILDIDNFKQYNDHYSHAQGDVALRAVCNVAMDVVKKRSGFLFRYGGEEFVAVLCEYTDDEIIEAGIEIKNAICQANIERDDEALNGRISVTIGCACEEVRDSLRENYIINADKQLYIGKAHNKGCVVYNGRMY